VGALAPFQLRQFHTFHAQGTVAEVPVLDSELVETLVNSLDVAVTHMRDTLKISVLQADADPVAEGESDALHSVLTDAQSGGGEAVAGGGLSNFHTGMILDSRYPVMSVL